MINVRQCIGSHDLLFVTLDALRYDVAESARQQGRTPGLARLLAGQPWEQRLTPGSFTLPAHQAFFAGFLPVPVTPGIHQRLFAAEFPGSETVGEGTVVHPEATWIEALAGRGYHTACIGGVGFFNKKCALGRVLPSLFQESLWLPEFGVTDPHSTANQVNAALDLVRRLPPAQRLCLFVNVSATHQPSCVFVPGAETDSPETQAAALAYADAHLARLVDALVRRAPLLGIICGDHGTLFGEEGYTGHRHPHPLVWTVPYMEFVRS